jgi:hypothetical protein
MREISIIEKRIIDEICTGKTHISKLFINHIPDLILDINRDNGKITLIIKPMMYSDVTDIATRQTEMIIYVIKFLLYLEDEGYIMTGNFAHGITVQGKIVAEKQFNTYQQNQSKYTNWEFTDKRIEEYIFKYCDLTIFPSYLLRIFKKHGYKTKIDKRHNQILFVSCTAILVSLFLGLWSIYQTRNDNHPTKAQIDKLIQTVQKVKLPQNLPSHSKWTLC